RFPASEWADRAKKARGDLALGTGHPLKARRIYAELATATHPIARSSGQDGVAAANQRLWRRGLFGAALLYVCAFVLGLLRAVRPLSRLRRWPHELRYYAPVALLFVLAAATEAAAI